MGIEEKSTVERIARQYRALFVHGIAPFFSPGENSLLYNSVTWDEKVDIVLALQPTLSASTIKPEEDGKRLWAAMGLIINGGIIRNAWFQDHGTKAKNLRERDAGAIYMEGLEKRIASAILRDHSHYWYNEFVIEKPEICGFYICDEKERAKHEKIVAEQEIQRKLEEIGMPLYRIRQGRVYCETRSRGNSASVAEAEISLEEILQNRWKVEEGKRQAMIRKIMDNSPFRLGKIKGIENENYYYNCFSAGEETYILLWAKESPEKREGEERIYSRTKNETTFRIGQEVMEIEKVTKNAFIPNGTRVKKIAEFFGREGTIKQEYFTVGNRLFGKRYEGNSENNRKGHVQYIAKYEERGACERRLKLAPEYPNDSFENAEEYLSCIKDEVIPWLKKKYEETQDSIAQHHLICFAYQCYGFAAMARSKEDHKNANEAERIATTIIAKEMCDELIKRRRGLRGAVKITEEDLIKLGYERIK